MSALTEKQIAAYEAKGFSRWTKGSIDRLYINAKDYGVTYDYYAGGKVSGGEFAGETFGAMEARRFASTKVFVDVKTGELSVTTGTDYEDEIREAVEAIIAEAETAIAEPEDEGAADDAKAREELTDVMRSAKYEPEARGEGFVVPGGEHDYYDGDFAENVNRIPNATFWEVARILSGGKTTTDALAAAICHARGISVELVSE